ncbi:hypothetical protein ACIGNX_01075 [Actinosynnema sp. NPDC053489]|uniref:hypothetical protein n=1 Tax=Actinosynnema sp. NPDC053489 TaxID=3363916 RepID=UPI0037C59F27
MTTPVVRRTAGLRMPNAVTAVFAAVLTVAALSAPAAQAQVQAAGLIAEARRTDAPPASAATALAFWKNGPRTPYAALPLLAGYPSPPNRPFSEAWPRATRTQELNKYWFTGPNPATGGTTTTERRWIGSRGSFNGFSDSQRCKPMQRFTKYQKQVRKLYEYDVEASPAFTGNWQSGSRDVENWLTSERHRGLHRIVMDISAGVQQKSVYYTNDHYCTYWLIDGSGA